MTAFLWKDRFPRAASQILCDGQLSTTMGLAKSVWCPNPGIVVEHAHPQYHAKHASTKSESKAMYWALGFRTLHLTFRNTRGQRGQTHVQDT